MERLLERYLSWSRKKKKLSLDEAFWELSRSLANYQSYPKIVLSILSGKHHLTGLEMTIAYRNGSCGMRSALSEWTNSSLEPLNEAFLNAVEVKNLVWLQMDRITVSFVSSLSCSNFWIILEIFFSFYPLRMHNLKFVRCLRFMRK